MSRPTNAVSPVCSRSWWAPPATEEYDLAQDPYEGVDQVRQMQREGQIPLACVEFDYEQYCF